MYTFHCRKKYSETKLLDSASNLHGYWNFMHVPYLTQFKTICFVCVYVLETYDFNILGKK